MRRLRQVIACIGLLLASCLVGGASIVVPPWGNFYNPGLPGGLTNVVKLAGGGFHILALKENGSITAWGTSFDGQTNIPAGLGSIEDIAAGIAHSVALRTNGTVRVWGYNLATNVPAGLSNVVSVAAGGFHSMALKRDGTIVEWGYLDMAPSINTPTNLSAVVAMGCGASHSLALKADGTVAVWGDNAYGQTNLPAGLTNIISIASGDNHILALRSDGQVIAWGHNSEGQTNVPVGLSEVVRIAAGYRHSLALKRDGTLVSWGDPLVTNVAPASVSDAAAIVAGAYYATALTDVGMPRIFQQPKDVIAIAGDQVVLQCSVGGPVETVTQWFQDGNILAGRTNQVLALTDVLPERAGFYHLLATNSAGSVMSSNANLTILPLAFTRQPTNINAMGGDSALLEVQVRNIGPFYYQWRHQGVGLPGATNASLLLTNLFTANAGSYSVLVSNSYGSVESTAAALAVVPISLLVQPTNQTRYTGDNIVMSVSAWKNGPFGYQWRFNGADLPGETNATLALSNLAAHHAGNYSVRVDNPYGSVESSNALVNVLESAPFILISPSNQISWAGGVAKFTVVADGSKPLSYQWRRNGVNLPNANEATLTLVNLTYQQAGSYSVGVSNSVGGVSSSSAMLSVLPVVAWGWNNNGQANVPTSLSGVASVAAGYAHSLAVRTNGSVVMWGAATFVPPYVTDVTQVAAAYSRNWALRSNGTVVAWGGGGDNAIPIYSNIVAIAAYGESSVLSGLLALRSDGTVTTMGNLGWYNGLTNVPAGLNSVVGVALGQYHYMALRSDGRVVGWQDYADYGANVVPNDLSNVVAIAAGVSHSMALRADGTVRVWRRNMFGGNSAALTNVPVSLSNVVAIAASGGSSLALKSDGTLVSWGFDSYGQTNVPAALSNVVSMAGGGAHYLALINPNPTNRFIVRQPKSATGLPFQPVLLSVGVVSSFPISYQWQFNGTNIADATNSFYQIPTLTRAAEGGYRVLVDSGPAGPPPLTSAVAQVTISGNSVIAWGGNQYGETNVPVGLSAVAIASGGINSLALTPEGRVVAWGPNMNGLTNVPVSVSNVTAIAAGSYHGLALKSDGKVMAWGQNGYPQLAVPSTLSNVVAIAASDSHSLALKSDGRVTQWGGGLSPPINLSNVTSVAVGYNFSLALKSDGLVTLWGSGPAVPTDLSNVVAVAGGQGFGLALLANGRVRAWGYNGFGLTNVPATLSNVVAISAGYEHAMAIRADGTPVSWGSFVFGRTNIPAGMSNALAVAAGGMHSVAMIGLADPAIVRQPAPVYALGFSRALLSVGVVSSRPVSYQWQRDGKDIPGATNAVLDLPPENQSFGVYRVVASNELGVVVSSISRGTVPLNSIVAWTQGLLGFHTVPPGLTEVKGIAAGQDHNLALRQDGTVAAWGNSSIYGQTNVPPGLSGVSSVAAGLQSSTVLKTDGRVVAWGYPFFGMTNVPASATNLYLLGAGRQHVLALRTNLTSVTWGDNTYGQRNFPAGLSNVVALAAGVQHSLALKPDGTVVAWGRNNFGQTNVPIDLTNAVAIATRASFNLALRADGGVVGWGLNDSGQATPPAGLSNIVAIAAGDFFGLALKSDGKVVAWGSSPYTNVPTSLSNVVAISGGPAHSLALTDIRAVAIVRQPVGATVLAGSPTWLSVGARSPQPLQFQWRFNGADLPNETNSWLLLRNPQSGSAGNYSVVVSNSLGSVLSDEVTLGVVAQAPVIVRHPQSQAVPSTEPVVLDVVAYGTEPLSYQWFKNGSVFSPGTNAGLSFATPQRSDGGYYSVLVSNSLGSVLSSEARLRVIVPQQISTPQFLPDGSIQVSAADSNGGLLTTNDLPFFSVWASTNLADWELLPDSLTLSNGVLWLRDYSATNHPQRFYRFGEKLAWRLPVPQQLAAPIALPNGDRQLAFGESNGERLTPADLTKFQVWASPDLVNWEQLTSTLTITNGLVWLRDDAATNFSSRFYRVIELP